MSPPVLLSPQLSILTTMPARPHHNLTILGAICALFLIASPAHADAPSALEEDSRARAWAEDLENDYGWSVGVEEPYLMNGGWRGKIQIVPQWPKGRHRKHLRWLLKSAADFKLLFAALGKSADQPLNYRWTDLSFLFFRSVGRTTPSAYAADWTVGYNVQGSLMHSSKRVTDTLFHEIFHLNDQSHGDWSQSNAIFNSIFNGIVNKCTNAKGERNTDCLSAYAPGRTKVYGKIYYAFHPEQGIGEYAAELAARYYSENLRIAQGKKPKGIAFKCKNQSNRILWDLLVAEFFSRVDLVGPCESS